MLDEELERGGYIKPDPTAKKQVLPLPPTICNEQSLNQTRFLPSGNVNKLPTSSVYNEPHAEKSSKMPLMNKPLACNRNEPPPLLSRSPQTEPIQEFKFNAVDACKTSLQAGKRDGNKSELLPSYTRKELLHQFPDPRRWSGT